MDSNWLFSNNELKSLINQMNIELTKLSFIKLPEESIMEDVNTKSIAEYDVLKKLLSALANPKKFIEILTNIGDSKVTRVSYSRVEDLSDSWVCIFKKGETNHIQIRSSQELRTKIMSELAIDKSMQDSRLGLELTMPSTLAFLGILDLYKKNKLLSHLNSTDMYTLYKVEDLRDIVKSSKEADFRWALALTNTVLVNTIEQLELDKKIENAIRELIEKEVIDPVSEEGFVFEATKPIEYLAEGYCNSPSKIALGVGVIENGELFHDTSLLIRTPNEILLTVLSGDQGSFVTLDYYDVRDFLYGITFSQDDLDEEEIGEDYNEINVNKSVEEINEKKPALEPVNESDIIEQQDKKIESVNNENAYQKEIEKSYTKRLNFVGTVLLKYFLNINRNLSYSFQRVLLL